jgi:hypothetical protein
MQELVAVSVPFAAVVVGLLVLRAVRRAERRSAFDAAAAILLVAYGALTLNNLCVRGVQFLGGRVTGYGSRYAAVAILAEACLGASVCCWAWARVRMANEAGLERGAGATFSAGDGKALLLQLALLGVLLVVVGIGMEFLRNVGILPWMDRGK